MGHDTNILTQPPVKLDYSLTGLNSTLAVGGNRTGQTLYRVQRLGNWLVADPT
jgi:hypothetical protein